MEQTQEASDKPVCGVTVDTDAAGLDSGLRRLQSLMWPAGADFHVSKDGKSFKNLNDGGGASVIDGVDKSNKTTNVDG